MDILTVINLEDSSGSFPHHVQPSCFNYHQLNVQKSILTPRDPDIISPCLLAQIQQLCRRKVRNLSDCSMALGEALTGQALGMLLDTPSREREPNCCKGDLNLLLKTKGDTRLTNQRNVAEPKRPPFLASCLICLKGFSIIPLLTNECFSGRWGISKSWPTLTGVQWALQCSASLNSLFERRGLEVLHEHYIQGDDKCSLAGVVIREFLARSCLDHSLLRSETHKGGLWYQLLREMVLRELQAYCRATPPPGL